MSTAFKHAKQKQTQAELRRIMNDHKNKLKVPLKIDSPLAKYNDLGQLTCILCQSVVRSENVWPVHVNSKQHREKVEYAKKLKEKTNNFTTPLKRSLTPPLEVSNKKIKGILKNAPSRLEETEMEAHEGVSGVPDDFFDNAVVNRKNSYVGQSHKGVTKMDIDIPDSSEPNTLPEGFFDDPKQDAKARNIEFKDPMDEEWEKFQKAIRDADNVSAAIMAEDQEEATTERQIDEIDEQMKNWSRVLTLEQKKFDVISIVNKPIFDTDTELSDSEDNFDEFLDWRSKKSFRH